VSNAAAVIGLTYNGTDLQRSDFGIFLEIRSGLHDGLKVRGTDTIVPGFTGRIARIRKGDVRDVELRGYITGNAGGATEASQRSSFRDMWQTLDALFSPSGGVADLVASLEDGTTKTLSCRATDILPGNQPVPTFQEVSITLQSTTPDWT
jgi:hypothetical protein